MRTEQDVDEIARKALEEAVGLIQDSSTSPVQPRDLSFTSWTPISARKKRKRRFTTLAVAARPTLVAKIPLDGDDQKVEREARIVEALSVPTGFTHPRLVAPVDRGFVMTFVPNADLPDVLQGLRPADFEARVCQVVGVVAKLHLNAPAGPPSEFSPRAIGGLYVDDPTLGDPIVSAALERALVGPTHGDLAPWNVRYDEASDRVGIIDWEDFRVAGIAAIDILNLLLTLGIVVFPDFHERCLGWLYEQVLEGDHWYAGAFRRALGLYCSLTRQSPVDVIDLLPLFCAWLVTRIEAEGRDASGLYYDTFRDRYLSGAPAWVKELRDA